MFQPHQNFISCHFFWPAPKCFWPTRPTRPLPKFNSRLPRTHTPTLPTPPTLFSGLVKLMWTAITIVYLQRNSTTDIPLEHIRHIENLFWTVASKFISTDKNHFQSWEYSEKYCRNWCHFDVFIIISRHTAWLEDSEAVAPMASKEKVFLKIS